MKITTVEESIKQLATSYAERLRENIRNRIEEMKEDDNSHYLIYRVLGFSDEEGKLIDEYQNVGRFLYKYVGGFLEEATMLCFRHAFPEAKKHQVPNTKGLRPKNFCIDCLIGNRAYEIKWRDATTDGDHIIKEHTRAMVIKEHGLIPVRIMFYYPNREQSIRVQNAVRTLYESIGGEYYVGDDAWNYIHQITGIDLKNILIRLVESNENNPEQKANLIQTN